jgi:hypothetical protein
VWDSDRNRWSFDQESPLHLLLSQFEWDYELIFPEDNSYGTKNESSSYFSGILGLIQAQVSEIRRVGWEEYPPTPTPMPPQVQVSETYMHVHVHVDCIF